MKLNIHIIHDELKVFSPILATSRDIDLDLRQIRLTEPADGSLEQDCVYLLSASAIEKCAELLHDATVVSIGAIDEAVIKASNLSAVMLPDDCDQAAIFRTLQDVFARYTDLDYSLMHSIAAKEPLQVIADLAALMLANPFAILDVTLKSILKGGVMPKNYHGTIWEIVLNQEYTRSEDFLVSKDDLYFFLHHDRKPYFGHGTPYKQDAHLMANIYFDNELFALLATTDIFAPLTQGQISVFAYVRDIMELAMKSSIEFKGAKETVTYYLIRLIEGFPVDDKVIHYHLMEQGWSLRGDFCVYTIIDPDKKELDDSQAEFCLFRIKKLWPDEIYLTYENSIIVITKDSANEKSEAYKNRLADLLKKLGLCCGYSQTFDSFSDLKYYYIQSKAALYEGAKSNPEANIWSFSDYYFTHIINLVDSSTSLKAMCHPQVLRLNEHDKKHDTDFVKCLRTYLFNGCNLALTGKNLFMHRNTLAYRLEKIAEIMEIDVQQLQENERMQLWLSCLLCDYL